MEGHNSPLAILIGDAPAPCRHSYFLHPNPLPLSFTRKHFHIRHAFYHKFKTANNPRHLKRSLHSVHLSQCETFAYVINNNNLAL